MAKYTYIKYDVKGIYVAFDEKFNEELYNNIGTTYEDYLDNKWVLLSNEQVKFHKENPTATVYEVWNMQLTPAPERTLDDARSEMKSKIENYDSSDAVDGFTINGVLPAWFTVEERSNYANSINAAELLGQETLTFYVGNMEMQVPTSSAKGMLAQVQLYADACYIVTKKHLAAVDALNTIEEVDAYDYKQGYPEKLNFNLPE